LPDKKPAAEPTPLAAAEVTGENFGERALELTRARVGTFDEDAALVAVMLTRTAVAHLQMSERLHRQREWSWSGFRIMWMNARPSPVGQPAALTHGRPQPG
jgi:hypothetical protein